MSHISHNFFRERHLLGYGVIRQGHLREMLRQNDLLIFETSLIPQPLSHMKQ